ncbi:MAG: DUF362 domain-containing protein [Dehalococcoidia bacterium]|nr:DUF362 domain-containing protein [Dehalococcoidia bacterium]
MIYLQETQDRGGFVERVLRLELEKDIEKFNRVLIKPNIVSYEPYPTTTHPAVLEACLKYFSERVLEIVVTDGPAVDAGNSKWIIENHPLKEVCDKFEVPLIDLLGGKMVKRKAVEIELELSEIPFEFDFILSLPVLKTHSICSLSGALKNQFGFLSTRERIELHLFKNIHRAIAELNLIVKPDLYIVDAIETLTGAQEVRHRGRKAELGYMLAGRDPVSLDIAGLKTLQRVEPKLAGKAPEDILHLRYAIELGVGIP